MVREAGLEPARPEWTLEPVCQFQHTRMFIFQTAVSQRPLGYYKPKIGQMSTFF